MQQERRLSRGCEKKTKIPEKVTRQEHKMKKKASQAAVWQQNK